MEKLVVMSEKELSRYVIVERFKEGNLNQLKSAELLGITPRHFRRLWKAYQKGGPSALISKKRGQPSNNRLSESLRKEVVDKIRSRYIDCGPTFVYQKLKRVHGIYLSAETVRRLMIENGLWEPRRQRKPQLHQSRERRASYGELIQADGSPHDWFEGRRERCCLLGFIDDATSSIMQLKFVETETTEGYFTAMKEYLEKHGRPKYLYTDRSSVFRLNQEKEGYRGNGMTQMGRALKELDIGLICAQSPQAKGRVERLFKTLQDRLVKELRLRKINDIEKANQYLAEYIAEHNAWYSISPQKEGNEHRPLLEGQLLGEIFCYKSERMLTKNLELSYGTRILQIVTDRPTYAMRGAKVEVVELLDGQIKIKYHEKELNYKELLVKDQQGRVLNRKQLNGGNISSKGMVA